MNETKSARGGRLLVIGAALFWGLAGICVKSITWGPMPQIAIRSVLSILVLIAYRRTLKIRWTLPNILAGGLSAVTGVMYIIAIKLTTAGSAIVLQYVAPIVVFLYSVIFEGRKPRLTEILLTAAVFLGIVLSFADSLDPSRVAGNVLALLSGFTFAGQLILMGGQETDSGDCLVLASLFCLVVSLPFLFTDKTVTFTRANILWLVILGVFQYGVANVLYGIGCKRVEPVECSLLLTLEPIFNPIPVALFYGEMMGPRAVLGAVIVIVCVAVYAVLGKMREGKA